MSLLQDKNKYYSIQADNFVTILFVGESQQQSRKFRDDENLYETGVRENAGEKQLFFSALV